MSSDFDLGTLRELRDIMDQDFDELIEAYLSDTSTRIDDVRAAVIAKDTYQLRELAHSLKGSCSNIGAVTWPSGVRRPRTWRRKGSSRG